MTKDEAKLSELYAIVEKIEDMVKIAYADQQISQQPGNEILQLSKQAKDVILR